MNIDALSTFFLIRNCFFRVAAARDRAPGPDGKAANRHYLTMISNWY